MDFNIANKKAPRGKTATEMGIGTTGMETFEKAVAPVPALSHAPIAALNQRYALLVHAMKTKAEALVITDAETNRLGVEMLAEAKKNYKLVEDERLVIVAPYKKYTGAADKAAKVWKDQFLSITGIVTPKVKAFALAEQKRVDAENEAAAKEAEALREKVLEQEEERVEQLREEGVPEAEIVKSEVVEIPVPMVARANGLENATGSVKLKKKWVYDLIHPAQLLTELERVLEPDEWEVLLKKINTAVKPTVNKQIEGGKRSLPGVRIYQSAGISVKVK